MLDEIREMPRTFDAGVGAFFSITGYFWLPEIAQALCPHAERIASAVVPIFDTISRDTVGDGACSDWRLSLANAEALVFLPLFGALGGLTVLGLARCVGPMGQRSARSDVSV